MHLGLKILKTFLEANQDEAHLVLATVIATEGSTYRKPGALMLANRHGDFAGLISGGCLESDLVARTEAVFATGDACRVDYDLKDDDELVLGLGLGCGGTVRLLLQRLDGAKGFQPLAALFDALAGGIACDLGLVTESSDPHQRPGTAVLLRSDEPAKSPGGLRALLEDSLTTRQQAGASSEQAGRVRRLSENTRKGVVEWLVVHVEPTPRVLVCGAGVDALPVVQLVLGLGWDCVVVDHRPASIAADRLPVGAQGICLRPAELPDALELERIDAAVVMSHHVGHDADYLAALATCPPPYLGLLGPRARKQQLLSDLGLEDLPVRGPVGLDLGAELPESIALAVVAEIHAFLNGRSGQSLDDG